MGARELGHQILKRRKAMGISQEELSQRADLSRNYISLIERGEAHNISLKVVRQLAMALGTTPAEMTGESDQDDRLIPQALREFALAEGLSYEMVDRLSRIPRRGKEPKTAKDWQALYNAIRDYLADND